MEDFFSNISIQVNPNTYLKNPESSALGIRIIAGSIEMIEQIGFENFTFQKLAKTINSTEASVYRYFESKHKLLQYLTIWYWGWLEYHFIFKTANIDSPIEKLKRAINLLTKPIDEDSSFSHINEIKLQNIIISESSKVYLTKEVDQQNKAGVFAGYKKLVNRVSDIILEINSDYKYPHMLVSTIIEGAHNQRFFADHLPGLTDIVKGEDAVTQFYTEMIFRTIQE
ncbi:MAG TPA: TetR/AcrR family transcriptional regulator [Salegentibacter sp.]|nr:TetR/AcrR family transcriptional regulator [Salegentibacter sp.]